MLLSCAEEGILTQDTDVNAEPYDVKKAIQLNVSNETMKPVHALVKWALRNADGSIIRQGEEEVDVPALSAKWLETQDFHDAPLYSSYASYDMFIDGKWVSGGTALFCPPKHFHFADPKLQFKVEGDEITVSASAYARSVEITCDDGDRLAQIQAEYAQYGLGVHYMAAGAQIHVVGILIDDVNKGLDVFGKAQFDIDSFH